MSAGDRCFALLQHLLPKQLLSRFIYHFMRSRIRWLKNISIKVFLRGYAVNMAEAVETDALAYPSFNAFFTRALKPEARPLTTAQNVVVSPVDGTVSQCGRLDGDAIIQAKGRNYSVLELLGGNAAGAEKYRNGHFACIYLAPYNYHRIHMPLPGTVTRTAYAPGDLFSVNAATARAVPRLFARNERVICEFSTPAGELAVVMVGALFVGSIETVWNGEINPPPRRRHAVTTLVRGVGLAVPLGAEIGRFNMGSTVILVFEPGEIEWSSTLTAGATVRMGERIGTLN